jgi:hypothetical protein
MELYNLHMHRRLLSREVDGNRLRVYAYNEHIEEKNKAQNRPLPHTPSWRSA